LNPHIGVAYVEVYAKRAGSLKDACSRVSLYLRD
jgi:hypothetical protein